MNIKFEWTPEISVGDDVIDNQHKKLLEKINELLDAILEKRDQTIINDIVGFFGEYAQTHLAYEEGYMREHDYPDFDQHKKIHDYFVEKYKEFKERVQAGFPSREIAQEVESFLGNWWLEHIGVEDKKYADFIKKG